MTATTPSKTTDLRLVPLQEVRWALPEVASWIFEQWYSVYKTKTQADVEKLLEESCRTPAVPSTLVAVSETDGGQVALGTASLLAQDMDSHPELSPWLADVFVKPEARGQGIARLLVRGIEALAKEQGLTRLYLFTPDQQGLYAKLGWHLMATELYRGTENHVMSRDL
ncbi:GNAT family N-acetyltransferase [Rhodovibrionaceae bacterium A322]